MAVASWWKSVRAQWVKSPRRTRRRFSVTGELEDRILLTVSAYEQLFLELINRARANPTAEATRLGIDLNEGLAAGTIATGARQPLAINNSLQTAIQGHLQDMIDRDYFAHNTRTSNLTPSQRMEAAGYLNRIISGENLAYKATTATPNVEAYVIQEHTDLFVDTGISGRGHRKNILESTFKEVGSGVRTGVYTSGGTNYNAVFTGNDFAARAGNSFLTGVVLSDSVTANNFYNIGEGLSGITIAVSNASGPVANTTSNAGGGYQLQLPAGTYTVTFSGTAISAPITKSFTIGTLNVKVDANTRTDVPAPPTIAFSASTYSINEAAGTATITVRLSRAAIGAASVRYATSNGTATSGSDYTAATGTLNFAIGESSKSFTIPILNDTALEPTQTVNLTLSAPVGITLGSQTTAVLSIVDNDVPAVNFDVVAKSVSELTTAASYKVNLTAASSQTITVNFALSGGTATQGTDFNLTNGTLTFAPGELSKTVSFTVINDLLDENDETIQIALSAPTNATLGTSSSTTYTITDNDTAPTAKFDFRTTANLVTSAVSVVESIRTLTVPIILSGTSARAITVNLAAITGGTALAGLDFSLASSSVTFAPGETRKSIVLNITEDLLDEANETINLALTSAQAVLGPGSTVTILDNDAAPTVSFTTATSSGREDIASPGTVQVALSAASGLSVTVRYAVTALGTTASSLTDYTLAAGTLTFLPGETTKTLPLVLKNNTLAEPTETIKITLSTPTNSVLGSLVSHVFSILDDELVA